MMANFQQQINQVVDSEKSHTDKIEKITTLGVEQIIKLSGINGSDCIVSIRERSGYKNSHMRLYYSSKNYKEIMNDRTKKTEVTKTYFKQDSQNIKVKVNGNSYYSNIYSLVDCKVSDQSNSTETSFKYRVDGFLTKCKEKNPNQVENLKKLTTCIVIGKDFSCARYQQSNSDKNSEWVDQIVVIYSKLDRQSIENKYSDIVNIIEIIFRSLDAIRSYELIDFERKALNQISTLAPTISNGSISASEAITKVTSALKVLLNNHLKSIAEEGSLDVFFIQVCERKSGDHTMPTFRIIPEMNTSIENVFEFSHETTPSISKYLLYREIKSRGKISDIDSKYTKMFEDIDEKIAEIESERNIFTMLVTNSDTKELWQFNKSMSNKQNNKIGSMAAYLLAGNNHSHKAIPSNSIIVFESDNPYLFSDELVSLLSQTVSLVSSIFKTIRMGDLTTDYRSAIREAYHKENSLNICDECAESYGRGAFKFDLSRINWFDIEKHFEIYSEKFCPDEHINEHHEDIKKFIKALSDSINDFKATNPENIHLQKLDSLNSNQNNIIDQFMKFKDKRQKKYFIDFLKLCPSDVIWHCWFGAIRAVLESRNHYRNKENGSSSLSFDIALPGYSALELLMVGASGEIAQVIKLGQEEKLKIEKGLYQQYVRYKILYAARIPHDGFAYECNGSGENDFRYGALVSDLVTGEDKSFSTLQNYTSPSFSTPDKEIENDTLKKAIEHLFNYNLSPWYSGHSMQQSVHKDVKSHKLTKGNELIKYTSRCPKNIETIHVWHDLYKKSPSKKINEKSINLLDDSVENLSNLFCSKPKKTKTFFEKIQINSVTPLSGLENTFSYSVIHGDLNNKNLIWSKDHERFFIIDFENIKSGFYGADQIFLYVSTICDKDTIRNFNDYAEKANNEQLLNDFIISTIHSIIALQKFLVEITNVVTLNNEEREKEINGFWNTNDEAEKYLSNVAFKDIARRTQLFKSLLLSTIKLIKKDDAEKDTGFNKFWSSAYRGFAVTQLVYALKNLYSVSKRNGHEGDFSNIYQSAVSVVLECLNNIKNNQTDNLPKELLRVEPAALSVVFALLLTMATFI